MATVLHRCCGASSAGLPIPGSVDGRSFAPLLRGEQPAPPWRAYIHGECTHSPLFDAKTRPAEDGRHNYIYEAGSHFLTDGKMKYIWYDTSGREQLFDIVRDPGELHDLAKQPQYAGCLANWRNRLVKTLAGREEGFSDGERLIPGCTPLRTSRKMAALMEQRRAEGFALAFQRKSSPVDRLENGPDLMR